MSQAAAQLEEVMRRAQSLLSSSGVAQDVKSEVQAMAIFPLSLKDKYRHISADVMLRENITSAVRQQVLESLSRLVKAFSILEKYGCNLTSPARPKYWRSVKHNNPVFRATVDAIKGGRRVLFLYGYTNQQIDGLSFPDDINGPDVKMVAEVTLEVMTLRLEMDMLIKGSHPHPENFSEIIPSFRQQEELSCDAMVISPKEEPYPVNPLPIPLPSHLGSWDLCNELEVPPKPTVKECNLCGGAPFVTCASCGHRSFCEPCDGLYHRHPARASHKRDCVQAPKHESCCICGHASVHAHCSTCDQRLCLNCDLLFHSHPDRQGHNRTVLTAAKMARPSLSPWVCSHCTQVNEVRAVLCTTCDRPRLASPVVGTQDEPASVLGSMNSEWQCKSCTMVNQGCSVLCEACERPRLATRPSLTPASPMHGSLTEATTKWTCQICTFVNAKDAPLCEMCRSPHKDTPAPAIAQSVFQAPSPADERPPVAEKPKPKPRASMEVIRQKKKDDGLNLIQHIREAEKRGVSPEEVCAALRACGGSNVDPCDWLTSELPHLLDEICAMAASVVQTNNNNNDAGDSGIPGAVETTQGHTGGVRLTRAEAKQAWLTAGGEMDKAVRQLLRDRQAKMRELLSLGFREESKCEEALRLSGGQINEALSHLQRPLLEPFHQRIWSEQPEAPLDPKHPDKQKMCRRLLALYDLPSWGRCELALSLLQEPNMPYGLEDVVQAVKESQDRDFIMRLLSNECPCCLSNFPRSKMQSLTSCQCYVCHECFTQHFTVAVRDKHIRDMVCPVCAGPDINDPEQLDSYFSTLDIQLRDCLDGDVYDLYHKKLTEHALMKDPKFLWCCHCTSGFINDGNQLKVTCPSCRKSFCAQCKKPWEPQHQDLSCERFHQWKRDNDPEWQKQGLAGYLRDNGITCPNCRFQYALTKGGCMHFNCFQCRYQFCSGCNNPFHTTACKTPQCKINGLHAHHPRDCLFYLRDWDAERLQALLQRKGVEFNINPPDGTQADACGVMEQKDEGGETNDSPCGVDTQPGRAGLCEKHYREYLVSLINSHRLDPALLFDIQELIIACDRYHVDRLRGDDEDENTYQDRLLQKLMEVPLREKVPRRK